MRRSPNRAHEQVSDLVLQDPVGRQPDRVPHPLGFELWAAPAHSRSAAAPRAFSLPGTSVRSRAGCFESLAVSDNREG
jgi:hypothetical protein